MMRSQFNVTRRLLMLALPVAAFGTIAASSAKADTSFYNVSIPTDTLNTNNPGGQYSILVELVGGAGNTVTLSSFNVSGLPSTISLTDSDYYTDDTPAPAFVTNPSPDSTLTFTLSTTNNPEVNDTPDEFSFYLVDPSTIPVPTTDPNGSLFDINLDGVDSPSVTTFQGTDPYEGLNVTVTPEAPPVPEPSTPVTLGIAFMGLAGLLAFRKRAKAVI